MDQAGWPYWATLPVAGIVSGLVGYLFGRPALKLEGHYLALATFALAVATPQMLKHKKLEAWTGGVQGITLTKPDAPFGLPLNADQWLYFVCLAVALAAFAIARNLVRARTGRAWVAVRDHPMAASAMGIDVAHYKALAFGASALFTGVAGALGAIAVAYVAPDSFTVFLSISLLVGIVVGGLASISGALYGAVFIEFVPNLADQISKSAPWAIYGLFLIASVYLAPTGIAGFVRRVSKRKQ